MAGVLFVIYVPTAEFEVGSRDKEQSPAPSKKFVENGLKPILENENAAEPAGKTLTSPRKDLAPVAGDPVRRISVISYKGTGISVPSSLHLHHPHIFTERKPSDSSQTPLEFNYLPLEMVLEDLLYFFKITDFTWEPTKSKNQYQICFTCSSEGSEEVLRTLMSHGIGSSSQSSVSILPCSLYYSNLKQLSNEWSDSEDSDKSYGVDEAAANSRPRSQKAEFLRSIKSRLTVAQVVEGVKADAALTFDYVLLLLLGSMIAALGLVENSPVVIVASMLVSPLMGPILAGTFGAVIEDKSLKKIGIVNELIGLALCLISGYLFGLVAGSSRSKWGSGIWPTAEMASRGQWRSLWVGALIAIPSGAGVALSVLGGNAGCLVGVAISASLLPPAVNAGVLWALSTVIALESLADEAFLSPPLGYKLQYSQNMAYETAISGIVSLGLTIINIICIFLTGVLVLRVKEVAPHTKISATRRFWKQDIRITRDYNKSVHADTGGELAERVRKEWVALNADKNPEKVERKLSSVIENVCKDETFLNVARYSCYPAPDQSSLINSNQFTWHTDVGKLEKRPHLQSVFDLREPPTRTRNFSQVETSLRRLRKKSILRHNSDANVYRHFPLSVVVHPPSESNQVTSPQSRFTVTETKTAE